MEKSILTDRFNDSLNFRKIGSGEVMVYLNVQNEDANRYMEAEDCSVVFSYEQMKQYFPVQAEALGI